MNDYKAYQYQYNKTNVFDDDLAHLDFSENWNEEQIIDYAVQYFKTSSNSLVFPAKSYAVAIIYSYLIEKNFKTDFLVSLNDPHLFIGTDKYFKPYKESMGIYDKILQRIQFFSDVFLLDETLPQVQQTIKYFNKEMGLRC